MLTTTNASVEVSQSQPRLPQLYQSHEFTTLLLEGQAMILAHPTCASAVCRAIDHALNIDVLVMGSGASRMDMDDHSSRQDHGLQLKIVHQDN